MLHRLASWVAVTLIGCLCAAQEYKGAFRFSGNDASQAEFYTNVFLVSVSGGKATVTIDLKAGPRSAPNDYVSFSGTLRGSLDASSLRATGTIHMAMRDGSRFQERDVPGEISGSASGGQYNGRMYLTVDGNRQGGMEFTLTVADDGPALLFPLGESKKVFDKGWLFGAEFKIAGKNGEEIDLSDKVQWSGTARFEPEQGPRSRPAFTSVGENKIILTAEYEGKKYKNEYKVITVNALLYARVGSLAFSPADSHGGPGDPLPVIGPIITGSADVMIDDHPAAREGDYGVHAACSGPNTFTITSTECDPDVRINDRSVAKLGTQTRHCGGYGNIVSLTGGYGNLVNLSTDVKWGDKKEDGARNVTTGNTGQLLLTPDKNTVMMILPGSDLFITDDKKNALTLGLNKGSIFLNGESGSDGRKIRVETPKETLERKGTRFLFSHVSGESRLIVYEGSVDITLKENGEHIHVPAGRVYTNNFKGPYRLEDTTRFESSDLLRTIPKDSASWKLQIEPSESGSGGGMKIVKKYWYLLAGLVVLGALLVYLPRRRK